MKRLPAIVSALGLAGILALRLASCHESAVSITTLRAGALEVTPRESALALRTADAEVEIAVDVDGLAAPIKLGALADGGVGGAVEIEIEGARLRADVALSIDRDTDAVVIALSAPAQGGGHELALRASARPRGGVFGAGVGEIEGEPLESGFGQPSKPSREERAVVLEGESLALLAKDGLVAIPEGSRLGVRTRAIASERGGRAELCAVKGASSTDVWTKVFGALGEPTELVRGRVRGATGPARVIGLDAEGKPALRFVTDDAGKFQVRAPRAAARWYAGQDVARTSAPLPFTPGDRGELVLDLSAGGELVVRVVDPDAKLPLTARVFVHGIEGTLDPSFGPDYRASGAGPLIDALRGELSTPLPAGRYRVSATKGIEWSVDAKDITIRPNEEVEIQLEPRRVIDTPGQVACDFHVHARPSFDSPVTPEDRVLSLVAAGIDFAVPSEHNTVGDYGAAIQSLDLGAELAFVPGVEVTTYQPVFGHFGVFPYPPSAPIPPYKDSTPEKLFAGARRGDDPRRVLQVNHPRMGKRIGYFDWSGWPRDASAPSAAIRSDFDAIELMNGFDMATPEKVELVLHDWFVLLSHGRRFVVTGSSDSHRIQYTWAGYPRTMVATPDAPIDPNLLPLDLKHGHAVVTSGPILDFDVSGAKPGDEVSSPALVAHVRVRAAPWVDVTTVELWRGMVDKSWKLEATLPVLSPAMHIGRENGTLEEARARALRLDVKRPLEVGEGVTWVVAIARGTRRMDDVLPFMPIVPWAVTNPVWVVASQRAGDKGH